MKKIIKTLALAAFMALSAFSFAASKKSIVCVTFPEYDWVMNILGDKASNFEVTCLQNNGTDLHSYQPSVNDLAKISTCDMLVFVGGESDEWVEKAVSNAKNKSMIVVNMLEVLGDKVHEEEIVEGMEHVHHEGEECHHHHHDGEEAHEHEHHHHDEEVTEADIKARKLKEFNGDWQSLYPHLMAGAMDEYVEAQAEKKGLSEKDARAEIEAKWNCGVKSISINGNKITFVYDDGKVESGKYKYAGFATKKNEEGKISSIRYKFESNGKSSPKYVMLNDHGHEPAKEVCHFHIYFGNNNFDELVTTKSNPFFVDSKLSPEACLDNVLGHDGHKHHEAEHHHEAEEGHHHHDHVEYDEHVWLSLKHAASITNYLSEKIQSMDSSNAASYKANTASYVKELSSLDSEIEKAVAAASKKTVIFGDRFPFRYFTDDYGLKYYAAFTGCSAESEASFETIVFLAKKVDELGINAIFTIEKSDRKIAKTVVKNTKNKKQEILEMDSLQSITQKEIDSGRNYLSAMKKNLEVLKKALR